MEVFIKSLKYIVGMISAAGLVIALAACASAPKLTGTEKIAVVSYTMERSIVRSGERPDPGPGILNSKDEDYYKYHKQAFAQAWAAFKAKAPAIFGPSRLVDFAQVEGNAEILALTVPVSIKLLGQETSVASNLMYPEGLNYCNIMDSKLSTKLAEITKADLLISVAIKAEYDMSSGIGFGVLSIGNGKMILIATVSVVTAQGKFLRIANLKGVSTEEASITGTSMGHDDFPRLIVSAQEDLSAKLANEFATW